MRVGPWECTGGAPWGRECMGGAPWGWREPLGEAGVGGFCLGAQGGGCAGCP